MRIIDVVQGSPEWAAVRANHFTASEAPAMAGVGKYQNRSDMLKQKFTGEVPEVTPAQHRIFKKGHAAEAAARHIAEGIIGEELYPCTATSDEHPWMLASFDGCTMLEDVIWEHKLTNAELRQATAETLPDHYKVQMDQQLAVSGAEKCLFMTSDGTEEDCNWFWYTTTPERIASLLAGWAQFKADLEAYQPQAQTVAPQGEAPDNLPALSIQMTGGVQASNLPAFKAQALVMIDSIKTELVTDKDFSDAESTVKFLQKGEKQLEDSKHRALEQTASIAELFDTIDELRENMRQKRLYLNKLVKAEKENRRLEIVGNATYVFDLFLESLDCPIAPSCKPDIIGAMRGKKTIATLQAAADDEVARAKVESQQLANEVNSNKALLDKEQGEYSFLFSDWREIIQKNRDDLQAVITARIAQHKAAEQAKFDAERDRIRQEEETKAREQAKAKAQQEVEALIAQQEDASLAQEAEAASHSPERNPIDTSRLNAAAANFQRGSQVGHPEMVSITRKEYDRLMEVQDKLDALEAAGVDKWSGYDDVMDQLAA